ncbi:MAG TPA: VacB/RNase II family 3'-5' exoribonuclease, partial [Candidatus Paceibacterota bacterium]|nr:VacB/RNase II family 3'-5' exoribonuclease [Candidatus Paceibacterota bacterium]
MNKRKLDTKKKRVSGIIEITRKATGYLPFTDGKEDVEIKTEDLFGALNGDTVEVELTQLFPRPKGKVVKIISRAREEFVSTLKENAQHIVAVPDDVRFYRPILLKDEHIYTPEEKVMVRLISFDGRKDPEGVIVKHLGRAGEHRVEMNAIVLEHGFRTEFPEDAIREAREYQANHKKIIDAELPSRTDYRHKPTCTIDPVNAKDFDDALSFVTLSDGEMEIGIHIADATHFVRPGTALDEEAKRRGTSVYLVDTTIPMLPHELSADIASLKPNEDRLAFSAVFRMNQKGEVLERRFEKSVIRSQKRFTYEEAQKVLSSGKGDFVVELGKLRALARILKKKREQEGAIDFGDNEFKFTLDEKGSPIKVERKERLETMSLIEEFMLLANREVAAYISKLAEKVPEKNLVFLYRIHDDPKEDRIAELATFVRAIGYEFGQSKKKKYSARDISSLLKEIEGKPEEHLIRTATLRSMAKAIYSTRNIGHFGLSFKYYTHFTSPIRRYPDMLVHRILASHLNGKPLTRKEFTDLEKLAIATSEQEAKAVDAERESIRYKQVEFMQGKIGQIFDAVISGVT